MRLHTYVVQQERISGDKNDQQNHPINTKVVFISREFQKTATVALAFWNVRGSHSSVVQNNNAEKCLLVNRESDLIIWITTVASVWETSQKIPSQSHSQLWVFAMISQERNQICQTSRKVSWFLCPCCSRHSLSLGSRTCWESALKEEISFEANWKAKLLRQSLKALLSVAEEKLSSTSLKVRCVQGVRSSSKHPNSWASLCEEVKSLASGEAKGNIRRTRRMFSVNEGFKVCLSNKCYYLFRFTQFCREKENYAEKHKYMQKYKCCRCISIPWVKKYTRCNYLLPTFVLVFWLLLFNFFSQKFLVKSLPWLSNQPLIKIPWQYSFKHIYFLLS